ncbi:hypothetical protein EJ377_21015 [Chryseobacterium arthrosphaerae]|uniref:Uncharacterized protein n=1 Tax=Chryseobacterium arthrosphaerae TaxID=651561 RepID=A0A3S0QTH5_9FLAO|nr:hypothetical protein EJ377_21015 [Chryseobacterium arthrosphaerae]
MAFSSGNRVCWFNTLPLMVIVLMVWAVTVFCGIQNIRTIIIVIFVAFIFKNFMLRRCAIVVSKIIADAG